VIEKIQKYVDGLLADEIGCRLVGKYLDEVLAQVKEAERKGDDAFRLHKQAKRRG